MSAVQFRRGNEADYAFGTREHGWGGSAVVAFHGIEEISRPFRFEVTLAREASAGPLDLDALAGAPATLAIAARDPAGFLPRHGVVAEAEEIDRTGDVLIYRVILVPHLERARHRTRCRTFVGWTLEAVIARVLQNGSSEALSGPGGLEPVKDAPSAEILDGLDAYVEPRAGFRWDVRDGTTKERLAHPALRSYVVQYNETDLDFVSRLLEEEGLSYAFDHAAEAVILRLTDRPGEGSIAATRAHRLEGRAHGMDAGAEEVIRSFRDARRVRSRAVTMRDYHWERSGILLEAEAAAKAPEAKDAPHFEFPARDEEVLEGPCAYPTSVRLERFEAERALAAGTSTVRGLAAGRRFLLAEADGQPREEQLVVRVETVATQHHFPGTPLDHEPFGFDGRSPREAPSFSNRFQSLRAGVRYRPARSTPRPRIDGIQTAIVTDQEGNAERPPEIHCDDWARVRVRFPWDQRDDGKPSSRWIRVSQVWAGAGYGGLYTPRVGHEVLVAYLEGDPDRPTIVGRVYNVKNPLPLDAGRTPEQSTIRSQSTPNADGSNELRFNDLAKAEEIYLHAQRNLTEEVLHDHATKVGNDQGNEVMRDQVNRVGKSRVHSVGEDERASVGGARTHAVGSDERVTIGGDRATAIGGDHGITVGGSLTSDVAGAETAHVGEGRSHTVDRDETLVVGGHRKSTVGGDEAASIDGGRTADIAGADALDVGRSRRVTVAEDHAFDAGGTLSSAAGAAHRFTSNDFSIDVEGAITAESASTTMTQKDAFTVKVGGAIIEVGPGFIRIDNGAGAHVTLAGGNVMVSGGGTTTIVGAIVDINP